MTEPRISFAPGIDRAAAVEEALIMLRREGVVVLDDLVDPALVARCRDELTAAYPNMAEVDRERNYGPYEGRHCMPMTIAGALADRNILLPAPVSDIAKALLAAEYKADSVGLLVSVPGAPDQIRHHDAWLYPDEGLDRLLPPFAIAFALPLVTLDATSGTTAFWRGSHRAATPSVDGDYDFAPVVQPGSAILWDFRVQHAGLANRGDKPRPVIFTVLSREWWVEIQPPEATRYDKLLVARAVHTAFKPRWRRRFSRAKLVDRVPAATETENA